MKRDFWGNFQVRDGSRIDKSYKPLELCIVTAADQECRPPGAGPTEAVIIATDYEKATVFHVNSRPDVEEHVTFRSPRAGAEELYMAYDQPGAPVYMKPKGVCRDAFVIRPWRGATACHQDWTWESKIIVAEHA
ncbi:hypothetical protein BG005_006209 [Podila minutissima]|nr:hypothetical protein BG005_006209 [Podila minutissima]